MMGIDRTKQISYCNETSNYILPMLKKARKTHTQQYDVYEVMNAYNKAIELAYEMENNCEG